MDRADHYMLARVCLDRATEEQDTARGRRLREEAQVHAQLASAIAQGLDVEYLFGGPPPPGGERWAWTLFVTAQESAVELWRDGELRVTVPLTAGQAELLTGRPVTLAGELRDDGFTVEGGE